MKFRKGLLVLMAATTLFTSCLKETDRVLEPFAAITNFSVGNFKVWYPDINIHGRDPLISRLEVVTNEHLAEKCELPREEWEDELC
mgnify:CR=1 FL=1